MRKLSLEEHKKYQLDILLTLDRFCRDNDLTYYLAYGTLIGAVRHKGFIPWDDDIDIWMPREDLEKFMTSFKSERYKIISPLDAVSRHTITKFIDTYTKKVETNVDYSNGNLGIDIDIFPLDNQPDDEKEFMKWYKKLNILYVFCASKILDMKKLGMKYKLYYKCLDLVSPSRISLIEKAESINAKYKNCETGFTGSVSCLFNSPKNRFKKELFDHKVELDFEGYKFFAPNGYHEILTKIYGDYMTPPEVQKTHHGNEVYANE